MAIFEVIVVKWVDDEGIEKREIGKLTLRGNKVTTTPHTEDFSYQISEGSHPSVPCSLRTKGMVHSYPIRQSVWSLIHAAVGLAIKGKLTQ